MPEAPSRIYRFEDSTTEVVFDDPATRAWLDEVLSPWFAAGDTDAAAGAASQYRVELLRAEDPLHALGLETRREPDGMRPCFALDSVTLEFAAWEQGERVVLRDATYSSYLEVGRERTRVVGQPGAFEPRVTLMRTVREVAACQRRTERELALHAAGFSVAGRTVLVLGPKEAGKTTLLLHVLATGEAGLVTNDRAFVRWQDAALPPHAIGVPTFVRVRPGTLAIFPEVMRGLPASVRPYLYSVRELASAAARSPGDGSVVMTPAQLCRQTGALPVRGGPLAAVLLPERVDEPASAEWKLEQLGADDACAALLANRYGLAGRTGRPTVFAEIFGAAERSAQVERRDAELARDLVSRVPVYRCRVGPTRSPEPERAAELLQSLSL